MWNEISNLQKLFDATFDFSIKKFTKKKSLELIMSLTSHNTSAASMFLVIGNEWVNYNGAITKLFLPLYY